MDSAINLSNLQSDVIRTIIRVGQESIDGMRLIGPQWNSLVSEHFTNRIHLPIINSFSMHKTDNTIHLRVTIPGRFLTFFGARKWKFLNAFGIGLVQYAFSSEDLSVISKEMTRIVSRFSRIAKFDLFVSIESRIPAFGIFMDATKNTIIDELNFPFIPESNLKRAESTLLSIVGAGHINRLSFADSIFSEDSFSARTIRIPTFSTLFTKYLSIYRNLMRSVTTIDLTWRRPIISEERRLQFENETRAICEQVTNRLNDTGLVVANLSEEPGEHGITFRIRMTRRDD